MPSRPLALAATAVAAIGQLVVLYAPEGGGPPLLPHVDKVVHVVAFALPVACALLARMPWRPVALVAALHAPVSEVVQATWLPARSGDPWDVVADLLGVALGLGAGRWLARQAWRRARGRGHRGRRDRYRRWRR